MSARKAALLVMAKMALSDGTVAEEERDFMRPLLEAGDDLDALLDEAKGKTVAQLIEPVDKYADRFFIALRAASMAAIDDHLDAREEALYERLVAALEISDKDRKVIQRTVAALSEIGVQPVESRIEELYHQSSFAEG